MTTTRIATETQPISKLLAEMEKLQATIRTTNDTGTTGRDPVLQVELTPQEMSHALYIARWEKYERLKKENAERLRRQTRAFFTQPWTAERLFEYIQYQAQRIRFACGSSFVIDQHNQPVIFALCLYFTQDERFVSFGKQHFDRDWSLQKGILLRGATGRGKTEIMKLFTGNPRQSFDFVPAQLVRNQAKETSDTAVVERYALFRQETAGGSWRTFFQTRIGYCFDDFGVEEHLYGTSVMQKVIEMAYNLKGYPWWLRHLTSMLTWQEMESKYGDHIRSRMREMFNDVILEGPDRRR